MTYMTAHFLTELTTSYCAAPTHKVPNVPRAVFDILVEDYPEAAGEVLIEAEPSLRRALLEELAADRIAALLTLQAVDDQVFLVESLPDERREEVLELVNLAERDQVETLADFIGRHAAERCRVLLVDPRRGGTAKFTRRMEALGFSCVEEPVDLDGQGGKQLSFER